MRAAPTIPCPAPDTMPPANDVPTPHVMTIQIDDAAPATYAYYGEPEAGPAQPRDQRRRLRDIDASELLAELQRRGVTLVLPATGRAS